MTAILLGLFGGAGATLLWELVLKPMRERRNVAAVLSAEVSLNLELLSAAKLLARPDNVPSDFELPIMVFEAMAERIGELPSQTVREVIFLYRYFKQLSELPKIYVRSVDTLRAVPADSPHRKAMESEIRSCVEVFNSLVAKAIHRVNLTQPMLLAAAFPWWSLRKYRRAPSQELDLREMAERVRVSQAERARLAEEIRKRDRE